MDSSNSPTNNEKWLETLTGEMLQFSLLGRLFFGVLDKGFLQSLIDQDIFSESPFGKEQPEVEKGLAYLQGWTARVQPELTDAEFDNLRADMTGLFAGIGKVKAPPWESVHFGKNRLVYQERTVQVREWYRRFGLEVEVPYAEPDDHVGLELAFLAHLARLGIASLEDTENSNYTSWQLLMAQKSFMQEHLLTWVFKWLDQVETNAKTDFYRGLAALTRGSVLHLAGLLEIPLTEEISS